MNDLRDEAAARGAARLIQSGLGLQEGHELLIVADEGTWDVARVVADAATKLGVTVGIYAVPLAEQRRHGNSGLLPPPLVAAINASYNLCTLLNGGQETLPFRTLLLAQATQAERAIAHLPGATLMALAATDMDYRVADQRNLALGRGLVLGRELVLTTTDPDGADHRLVLDLGGWSRAPILSGGTIARGSWGNLPGGEAYIAPLGAEGELLVDGSIDRILLQRPVLCRFEDGRLIDWETTDESAARFLEDQKARCEGSGDTDWSAVGELGIGTNDGLRELTDSPMLNEKVLGTCHVGLGHSKGDGGGLQARVQVKLVCRAPTIDIDGARWLTMGRHDYALDDHGEDYRAVSLPANWSAWRCARTGYQAEPDHGRLYRVWHNQANKRHRVTVGNRATAQVAARLYQALGAGGRHEVGALAESCGIEPDAAAQVLSVMARYQVVELLP